ncbi:uncharacterized protein LOC124313377 isoform X1 [Daphnia pulicaria]|uniref:uncharacterized protein LOC124313375 isoform X1 n=1 Tax=Daphnia pulicaria TaxID=35523 RepID=UPI001EEC2EE3|nr:uncharacterized protein LOC124313375 isoform X1 [Daphnia pulicaria]XP_046634239.1 uncharacterized protein LOC124313377 isoform X1 [Daphnia pulicaria]
MQLLRGAGQLTEADQPNQKPPLPATTSQINVDHFHQLSRATVDTQDSSFGLDCQVNGVVQVSNTQRSHSNMQLLSRAGQLDEDYPPNQQPQLTANIFSSISCNTNRSTSVNAKPGRGRSTGSGTGSRRGNRGSQIRAVPVSGEGVTRNSYTTAYCYQSVYYALKPNSSPPEYYLISKRKLPSQYSTTIELQQAPVLAKC